MRMKIHPQYFISQGRRSSKVRIMIGIDLGDTGSGSDGGAVTEHDDNTDRRHKKQVAAFVV